MLFPLDRGCDDYGCGHFGASRGSRKHIGIDFVSEPGQLVTSDVAGKVTKLGYPYGDDLSFRYVQVTTDQNVDCRYFYCQPSVAVSDIVKVGNVIGKAQDIAARYTKGKMTNHIHFEVKRDGHALNPVDFLRKQGVQI